MIVSFEGIDGSGKATQAALLRTYVRGKYKDRFLYVNLVEFPDYGGILGKVLENVLQDSQETPMAKQILCLSDMLIAQEYNEGFCADYEMYIMDRWFHSAIAYGASQGAQRDKLKFLAQSLREPNLTIFLNLPSKHMEKRNTILFLTDEEIEMSERVNLEYKNMALDDPNFVEIDATLSKEDIHLKVIEEFEKRIRA